MHFLNIFNKRLSALLLFFLPLLISAQTTETSDFDLHMITMQELIQENQESLVLVYIDSLLATNQIVDTMVQKVFYGIKAEILSRQNNWKLAIPVLQILINLTTDFEEKEHILLNLGLFKKYTGDFDGAINTYEFILKNNENNPNAINNLASVYNEKGNYKNCIKLLDKYNEQFTIPYASFHYAKAFYHLKQYNKALLKMEDYLNNNPLASNDFIAFHLAALIYKTQKDNKKACFYNEKALNYIHKNDLSNKISKETDAVKESFILRDFTAHIQAIANFSADNCLQKNAE
jgi:tetratricopeptide (TPR) repeat protein